MHEKAHRQPWPEEFILNGNEAEHYPTGGKMWFISAPPDQQISWIFPRGTGDFDELAVVDMGMRCLARELTRPFDGILAGA